MTDNISQQIKLAREASGLSQSKFAKLVDVPQQYIDRWEKGAKVNPKYLTKLQRALTNTSRPLSVLPLESLSQEDFERFCCDLLGYIEDCQTQRYGTHGDKQDGIDVVSERGTIIQCKRRQSTFGKSQVAKVISDYDAAGRQDKTRILAITKTITRSEIDAASNAGWQIWGNEELTRQVQHLHPDEQRQLMRTYFPGNIQILENCLGLTAASVLISGDEFFAQYNNATLTNYNWPYQSNGTLERVLDDINSSRTNAILISGRGGIGKTRLLKELYQRSSKKVLFLQEGASLTPELALECRERPLIIVIDDAYRRQQELTSCLQIAGSSTRLLVTTRPYALDEARDTLNRRGLFDSTSHYELKPLDIKAAENLAYEIIGQDSQTVQQLVHLTKDNTLLLTVCAKALRDKKILPTRMLTQDNVRDFLKELVTSTIKKAAPNRDLATSILRIAALTQPFERGKQFTNLVHDITGDNAMKINQTITQLLNSGLMQDRHRQLRITPDLLADYELKELIDEYPEIVSEILEKDGNSYFGNIVQNLCLLDWQTDQNQTVKQCIKELWGKIIYQYRQTGHVATKLALLELVQKVAYYQPAESLDFAKIAIADAPNTKLDSWRAPGQYNNNHFLEAATLPILKAIAHIAEYLPEVFSILAQLADTYPQWLKDKSNDTPLKIMQDIVKPKFYKPDWYIEQSVNYVINNLFNARHNFSPFEMLDAALETDVEMVRTIDHRQAEFYHNNLKPEHTTAYRPQILQKVLECLTADDTTLALRAAATVGVIISTQTDECWDAETITFLKDLTTSVANSSMKPIVLAKLILALKWVASRKNQPALASTINIVFETIQTKAQANELNLALSILDPYGHQLFIGCTDYEQETKDHQTWLNNLAGQLIVQYKDDYNLLLSNIKLLERQAKSCQDHDATYAGHTIINACCQQSKDFCIALAETTISHRHEAMYLYYAIFNLAQTTSNQTLVNNYIDRALKSNQSELLRPVIEYITRMSNIFPLPQVQSVITQILKQTDDDNLTALIQGFFYLPTEYKTFITNTVNHLQYNTVQLTQTVTKLLSSKRDGGVNIMDLSDDGRSNLLTAMVNLKQLGHSEKTLLQDLAQFNPCDILKLIFNRVQYQHVNNDGTYFSIPHIGSINVQIARHQYLVQQVVNWAESHPNQAYYITRILKLFSIKDDIIIDAILAKFALNDQSNHHIAKQLIASLPCTILASYGTVEKLLQYAYNSSSGAAAGAEQALFYLAISTDELQGRAIGQPGPHELWLQRMTADGFNHNLIGQYSRKLYQKIANYAKEEINRQIQDDRELLDYE